MRFDKAGSPWQKKRIKDFCIVNPRTEDLAEQFVYIDLESVSKGRLLSENIIKKDNAPSRAQRVLEDNDILFQCVRPYQLNNLYFKSMHHNLQYVASTGYAQIRTKEYAPFIYHLLHTPNFNKSVLLRCTGSSYPAITSSDLEDIETFICDKKEQQKIGFLLNTIDERIEAQSKIIEDLETYKKTIQHKLFSTLNNCEKKTLGLLCSIKTGKLDANAMVENGEYKFFTCAKEDYLTNTYAFNGEALLISGNGEIGLIKYYCGKFNAYQRTYVLQNFGINPIFLKFYLEYTLPRIVYKEKNVGAMPYIVLSTLSNIEIPYNAKKQMKITELLTSLEKRVQIEKDILTAYKKQKAYLLQNMFI